MNSNNKTLQGLKKVNDRLLGIEIFLLALITILLVAAIFIEVVCRYFLFISAAWAEELTRYLFIWLTYIGSAYAICDNNHTEMDTMVSTKPSLGPRSTLSLSGSSTLRIG